MKLQDLFEESKYDGQYAIRLPFLIKQNVVDQILEKYPEVVVREYKGIRQFEADNKATLEKVVKGTSDVFFCCSNRNLKNLNNLPPKIDSYVNADYNEITSLKDLHKHVKEIKGQLELWANPVKSHVLSVFFIRGLTQIILGGRTTVSKKVLDQVMEIVNKHLKEGRAGLPKAQNELIEAGLEDYAQI